MNLKDISVIVPTRNEAHNIGTFLHSLPDEVNLVVVDASDDTTPEIIRRLRPRRTVVLRDPSTITRARQLGAGFSTTAWLVFADADVSFHSEYFRRLCRHGAWDAVYGPKQSHHEFTRYYRWCAYGQHLSDRLGVPAATGSNLAVRRNALNAVGGFDPELVCNEDSELIWRVKRAGFAVSYDPSLIVYAHDHRRLYRGLWRKSIHSIVRCALLFCNAMPSRWRGSDWGYWSSPEKRPLGPSHR
ncbi:MAG: glycosyltransferase [Gammaproteobacteria bacterium]|jgi:glycosyltransferase involved in cell wall biosynthesis